MTALVFIRSSIDNTPEPQLVHDTDANGRPILPGWQKNRVVGKPIAVSEEEVALGLAGVLRRRNVGSGHG